MGGLFRALYSSQCGINFLLERVMAVAIGQMELRPPLANFPPLLYHFSYLLPNLCYSTDLFISIWHSQRAGFKWFSCHQHCCLRLPWSGLCAKSAQYFNVAHSVWDTDIQGLMRMVDCDDREHLFFPKIFSDANELVCLKLDHQKFAMRAVSTIIVK